jgi:hypothetical protein
MAFSAVLRKPVEPEQLMTAIEAEFAAIVGGLAARKVCRFRFQPVSQLDEQEPISLAGYSRSQSTCAFGLIS